MSREGSGRVAVLKMTGLIRSYTLECNYNTGRVVNVLPPTIKEYHNKGVHTLPVPPKYNPHVFEEVNPPQINRRNDVLILFFSMYRLVRLWEPASSI